MYGIYGCDEEGKYWYRVVIDDVEIDSGTGLSKDYMDSVIEKQYFVIWSREN